MHERIVLLEILNMHLSIRLKKSNFLPQTAWYIDPRENAAGFSPHRDRQPTNEEVENSFHKDGQAKYVTLWMALSNATPENSCIYVIPKQYDPGYLQGDDVEENHKNDPMLDVNCTSANDIQSTTEEDPLARCLKTKESYQNIRALPTRSGESVAFTHRIIHWGSRGNSNCEEPRIAISFVTSDPSFEKPYLKNFENYSQKRSDDSSTTPGVASFLPPFHIRLLMVCAQLLIYYQRFDLPHETIRACYEYCKLHKEELDESYWKKVSYEFVNAMSETRKEIGGVGQPSETQQQRKLSNFVVEGSKIDGQSDNIFCSGDNDEDEEEEEAILEAMLENESEVEDDFDRINQDEDTGALASGDEFDDDSVDEEDDDYCDLFAQPTAISEPPNKKLKIYK